MIPQHSFVLGLESSIDLSKKARLNTNVLLKGTGEIFWHEDNAAVSSAYNLLNAKIGITLNKNFTFSVFGNNILDENYITEFFGEPFSNGGKDVVWVGNPAIFGTNLRYNF